MDYRICSIFARYLLEITKHERQLRIYCTPASTGIIYPRLSNIESSSSTAHIRSCVVFEGPELATTRTAPFFAVKKEHWLLESKEAWITEFALDDDDDSVVALVDLTWRESASIKNSSPIAESITIRPGSSVNEKRVCAVCFGWKLIVPKVRFLFTRLDKILRTTSLLLFSFVSPLLLKIRHLDTPTEPCHFLQEMRTPTT